MGLAVEACKALSLERKCLGPLVLKIDVLLSQNTSTCWIKRVQQKIPEPMNTNAPK